MCMPQCSTQICQLTVLTWVLVPVTGDRAGDREVPTSCPPHSHIGHHVLGAPEELGPSSTLGSCCCPYVDPPTLPGASFLVMPCQQVSQGAWGPKKTIPSSAGSPKVYECLWSSAKNSELEDPCQGQEGLPHLHLFGFS